jgi:hypothetical protein
VALAAADPLSERVPLAREPAALAAVADLRCGSDLGGHEQCAPEGRGHDEVREEDVGVHLVKGLLLVRTKEYQNG